MKIIGRTDMLNFPELGLKFVESKIDTGAFTSSLHYKSAEVINNVLMVDFGENNVKEFTEYSTMEITSSNGQSQERFLITTTVELFGEVKKIKLTLSDRSTMKFQALIGRTFLSDNNILVNVKRKNVNVKSIKSLLEGIEDFNIYFTEKSIWDGVFGPLDVEILEETDSIYDLFHEIEINIYGHDLKTLKDFRRPAYLKELKQYYIINNGTRITLNKFASFVKENKEEDEWYMKDQELFID